MYPYDSLGQWHTTCRLVDPLVLGLVVHELIVSGQTPTAFPSRIQLSTLL
jgi:hypothetical protein